MHSLLYYRLHFQSRIFLLILFLVCYGVTAPAQSISFSNGASLKTEFCHEDNNYGITGYPSGGTFEGCGVFQQNGQWYFNPRVAAESAALFPHVCELEYFRNGAAIVRKSITVHKPVTIHPPLQDTFTCNGRFLLWAATLYAGDYDYVWTPEVNLVNPQEHQTEGTLEETVQKFAVSATDAVSGCSGSDSMIITNKSLNLDINPERDRICPGDSFVIGTKGHKPGNIYQWSLPVNASSSGMEKLFSGHLYAPGDNVIQLKAANDRCTADLSIVIHVIDVGLTLHASDELVNQGTAVKLYTEAMLPHSIIAWLPEYLFPDQGASVQSIMPDSSRSYKVIAISDEGCMDTAELMVKVNPIVFMPNAFSPNGDGINDFFKPVSGGDDIIIGSFQVYNRYGQLVYSVHGSANVHGWDGTCNGQQADMGTYYYYVELATRLGEFKVYKGDFLLMR